MIAALLCLGAGCFTAFSSDHADPMSASNPFKPQADPLANITDLHAFVVDADGKPVLSQQRIASADQLIISLCVRPRLLLSEMGSLSNSVAKYSFRAHLDLNPGVRFFDPSKTRDGRDYQATLMSLNAKIAAAAANPRGTAHRDMPNDMPPSASGYNSEVELRDLLLARGALISEHEQDESMQALYGGIIENPGTIAEEALLDFGLRFVCDGNNCGISIDPNRLRIEGISAPVNLIAREYVSPSGERVFSGASSWKHDAINVESGVFDDPFIFPSFFRRNVIGIVTSIPLKFLHRPDGAPASSGAMLLWATSHRLDGSQIDHVGRSLRTQLPRFGYLNQVHPSRQVAEIMRVHGSPNLMEDIFATFIPPLEAHRHYDNAPDVMIYDLRRPAKFPNGRWFEDDVAKILADAGETLLFELSYAQSRQFPRSTINDKPFRLEFPYLAPAWTQAEIAGHSMPGAAFGDFMTPDPPDTGALAQPDFVPAVWRSLWLGLVIGILLFGALAWLTVRGLLAKTLAILAVIAALCLIWPIRAPVLSQTDPGTGVSRKTSSSARSWALA